MPRLSAIFIAFAFGAASAVALVACGGGKGAELLPGTTADQIESNLDKVAALAREEDCVGAEDAVAEVTAEVEELEGVDLKLKAALEEGTAKLSEVVARCEEENEEAEPELETTVEAEEPEEEKKPKQDKKAEKEAEKAAEQEEEAAEGEGPSLPPQSNGKGEEKGKGGGEEEVEPESEETPPSGGVGPGVGVE